MSSTVVAHSSSEHCYTSVKHTGEPKGKIEKINGVDTYIALPSSNAKGVILFYSDVFGPTYFNNQLVMDYFAENGTYQAGDFAFYRL
jgi:hypothetical protein